MIVKVERWHCDVCGWDFDTEEAANEHAAREDRRCMACNEDGGLAEWTIGDRLLVVHTIPPIRAKVMTVVAEKRMDHTIYPLFDLGEKRTLDGSSGPYAFLKMEGTPQG